MHRAGRAAGAGPIARSAWRWGRIYKQGYRSEQAVRICLAMPRHSVMERSDIAFSMKIFLKTAPVEAANSAASWRGAQAGTPCAIRNLCSALVATQK